MTFEGISGRVRGAARSGLSLVALVAVLGVCVAPVATLLVPGAAHAQDDHDHEDGGGRGGQGGAGAGGQGSGGGGSGGHDDGGHDDGGHDDEGHEGGGGSGGHEGGSGGHDSGGSSGGEGGEGGQGQGGPGDDSDGQGPRAGQSGSSGGGQPPWASEGIPEVELGRLSVARSPDRVIDRAYAEALLTLGSMSDFYNLPLQDMITQLSTNWDGVTIIDSPLQNLALLRDALDGSIDLSAAGISNDIDTLMAVFLGVASDKSVPITPDTATALSIIFEMPLTASEAAALAAEAEAIRQAVLLGHG